MADAFDELMKEAFPEGAPEKDASVVIGDDHMALHILEAICQVVDTFGVADVLVPQVERVLYDCATSEVESCLRWFATTISNFQTAGAEADQSEDETQRVTYNWIRDAGAALGRCLIDWMNEHTVPRFEGWVYLMNHGFYPMVVDPALNDGQVLSFGVRNNVLSNDFDDEADAA